MLHCIISPRLASKHDRADRCVASSMDNISCAHFVLLPFKMFLSYSYFSFSHLILSLCSSSRFLRSSDFCLFCLSLIAALQTRPVYSQRARRHTCGGCMGSLESFRYLFADLWRRHQDRRARMQPARVSSPSLCSHACPVDLVSILAARVSVP